MNDNEANKLDEYVKIQRNIWKAKQSIRVYGKSQFLEKIKRFTPMQTDTTTNTVTTREKAILGLRNTASYLKTNDDPDVAIMGENIERALSILINEPEELVTVTGFVIDSHYHLVDMNGEYSRPYDSAEEAPIVQGYRLVKHVTVEDSRAIGIGFYGRIKRHIGRHRAQRRFHGVEADGNPNQTRNEYD